MNSICCSLVGGCVLIVPLPLPQGEGSGGLSHPGKTVSDVPPGDKTASCLVPPAELEHTTRGNRIDKAIGMPNSPQPRPGLPQQQAHQLVPAVEGQVGGR